MSETVLVVGATSGIAKALCQELAARGCDLVLAGRNIGELEKIATDLTVRHKTQAVVEPFDALDFEGQEAFYARCVARFDKGLDTVVLCYGSLPDQLKSQADAAEARKALDINFTSAVTLLELVAADFESRRRGTIVVLSSVAGDRGRQSNYIYGSAKAGLTAYLQGLRNRLARSGVHVVTIKPGFVDTPMTQGLINPNSPLVASPEQAAKAINRAIVKRKNVAYVPWFWWPIMTIICSIPEPIFKRLKL